MNLVSSLFHGFLPCSSRHYNTFAIFLSNCHGRNAKICFFIRMHEKCVIMSTFSKQEVLPYCTNFRKQEVSLFCTCAIKWYFLLAKFAHNEASRALYKKIPYATMYERCVISSRAFYFTRLRLVSQTSHSTIITHLSH